MFSRYLLVLSLICIPIVPPASLMLLIMALPPAGLVQFAAELPVADPIIDREPHPATPYIRPPVLWSDPIPTPTREEYEEP